MNYEKGAYSIITYILNHTERTLTINDRKCSFPGMMAERKLTIVRVTKNKGIGADVVEKSDREITHEGKKIKIKL
jgi:alpha-D-xyloside xylohydrolase